MAHTSLRFPPRLQALPFGGDAAAWERPRQRASPGPSGPWASPRQSPGCILQPLEPSKCGFKFHFSSSYVTLGSSLSLFEPWFPPVQKALNQAPAPIWYSLHLPPQQKNKSVRHFRSLQQARRFLSAYTNWDRNPTLQMQSFLFSSSLNQPLPSA